MLARVGRLERTDAPALSPFERDYGSLENMAAAWRAMMDAGTLDRLDGEHLITIIVRWHTDRCWDLWR
ncbi:hypothetical protein [Sphingomonas sp. CCH5-D11]|uniref:hypothetical protein n=1 Tax=Sphingomonas sp. CCH5-D11 TaxID=1768786 RepID=UPI000A7E952E|nr:hypothetical protein [Sphingomonas sp. CCH5-D11]